MKKFVLGYAMKNISATGEYDDEKLEIIAYGLEAIYLTITKMIVLFGLAILLNIVKEFLLILLFYNIIRMNAFGIHASKSIYCLISSTTLFIGGALLCRYISIPYYIQIITSILALIGLILYAPADTHKRPLINKKKRKRYKILSILSGIIYVILVITLHNNSLVNYIWLGLIEATLMILPLTYKIFNLPYNNYKSYNCGV